MFIEILKIKIINLEYLQHLQLSLYNYLISYDVHYEFFVRQQDIY